MSTFSRLLEIHCVREFQKKKCIVYWWKLKLKNSHILLSSLPGRVSAAAAVTCHIGECVCDVIRSKYTALSQIGCSAYDLWGFNRRRARPVLFMDFTTCFTLRSPWSFILFSSHLSRLIPHLLSYYQLHALLSCSTLHNSPSTFFSPSHQSTLWPGGRGWGGPQF